MEARPGQGKVKRNGRSVIEHSKEFEVPDCFMVVKAELFGIIFLAGNVYHVIRITKSVCAKGL